MTPGSLLEELTAVGPWIRDGVAHLRSLLCRKYQTSCGCNSKKLVIKKGTQF